jgi:hypothetical protein
MPSPTPAFVASLIRRLGSEEKALEYLGRWSEAILMGQPIPRIPTSRPKGLPKSQTPNRH